MQIIGLMGAAGAGKDSVADIIMSVVPSLARFAFADLLRHEIASAFGIDPRVLMDRTLRDTPLEQLAMRRCTDPQFIEYAWELTTFPGLRPRNLMQRWGDFRRLVSRPSYFVEPAEAVRVRAVFDGLPLMVVTDVRFPNEVAWVQRNGGQLWRITRRGLVVTDAHVSEHATRDTPADATIRNDGTIDDLRRVVIDLLTPVISHAAQ